MEWRTVGTVRFGGEELSGKRVGGGGRRRVSLTPWQRGDVGKKKTRGRLKDLWGGEANWKGALYRSGSGAIGGDVEEATAAEARGVAYAGGAPDR